ncbi:MAG: hypothetical protein P4L77_10640 [Sulfuriferula sp.]|nr:hypothetical protein [Sulfuriferula sp.]
MNATGDLTVLLISNNHKTFNKTDNFLEMSAEWEGAQVADRILKILVTSVWQGAEQVPEIHCSEIKQLPDGIAFGPYNEYLEIYSRKFPGVVFSQIQFNRKSGDFYVLPSMQSDKNGWTAHLDITRGQVEEAETSLSGQLDLGNVVDRLNQAFKTIEELAEIKLTEEQAFQLASHKHYKGGLYRAVGPIRDADDAAGPGRMLYFHLFPHHPQPWHRNTVEYNGLLENGQQRFAVIEDDVPLLINEPTDITIEVNLRMIGVNRNGMIISKEAAEQAIAKLNERARHGAVFGEYGQPRLPAGEQGEKRAIRIEDMNVCCQFVHFGLRPVISQQGKPVHAMTATVQPAGPMGMDFFDKIKDPKANVGFAMRAFTDDSIEDGQTVRRVKQIITFDFVAK